MDTSSRNKHILTGVEYFNRCPLPIAVNKANDDAVLRFIYKEIVHPFGLLKSILPGNALCLTATSLHRFSRKKETQLKTVLARTPLSNEKAERMNGKIKL